MADLASTIADFGADPAALRLLDRDGPDLLPYATLLTARRGGDADLGVVTAVYEWQGAPLIFLVDAGSLADEDQLNRIRRLLAMRGDAPYLGIVAPGQLNVYRIALDSKSPAEARIDWVTAAMDNRRPSHVSAISARMPRSATGTGFPTSFSTCSPERLAS